MSLDAKYDQNNIFAKIIRGDMPCVKLFENENILSFMDVFPQSRGHSLVIHKKAVATNLFDVDPASLAELTGAVQQIARGVKDALAPDGLRIVQFNGAPAGQTVFHLHFHIIPVFEGEPLGAHHSGGPTPSEDLEKIAANIRAAL